VKGGNPLNLKTMIYTAMYLLLAFTIAHISVVYLGITGMGMAISLIVTGFALVGASAFKSVFSRRWDGKGGQRVTIILRNILGIPLWVGGFVLSWLEPSAFLLDPGITLHWIILDDFRLSSIYL
jgi:hypothetical protein